MTETKEEWKNLKGVRHCINLFNAHGMSLAEFCRRTGISYGVMSHIKKERTRELSQEFCEMFYSRLKGIDNGIYYNEFICEMEKAQKNDT